MPQRPAERLFPGAADRAVCRDLIRTGSRSFHAASLILPERVRDPAYALYAFCRLADDAVDTGERDDQAVARLQARLDAAYDGHPADHPVDRAFADMIRRFEMPKTLPQALIEGLDWDAAGRRYRTLSDLRAYSARVAGTVGAMMTVLMGVRDSETLARACDLGVAMQLTNIARDIGEDARNGRVYLPLDWLDQAGIDVEAWLERPAATDAVIVLTERLLAAAEDLYDRALPGIARLPVDCRPAIHAARALYREIGREVARNGYDSVSRRAVVSGNRKLAILANAAVSALWPAREADAPVLTEVRFLVDAVGPASTRSPVGLRDRTEWVLRLFDRLGERDLAAPLDRGGPARPPVGPGL